jgi:endonuclease/exonuclease/phosphatase family metal-dependent hydrolase
MTIKTGDPVMRIIFSLIIIVLSATVGFADAADEKAFLEDAINPVMKAETADRVSQLLNSVRVVNSQNNIEAPSTLHVLEYNIEQGMGYPQLELLLSNPQKYIENYSGEKPDQKFSDDVLRAAQSDLLIISEADLGLCRSGYRDVSLQLAQALKMNMASGTEFLELEPKDIGAQKNHDNCANPDYSQIQNLTTNAILSKFPISNVRRIPLENCYNWYEHELKPPLYKKMTHWPRQLRRGQRMALIADISIPGQQSPITVVSTHLEINSKADCRATQMAEILDAVKTNANTVIIGGDLNTMGLRGSEEKLFTEWKTAGFDLSANDGEGTAHHFRLDYVGVKGSKPTNGKTLSKINRNGSVVSDHAPVALDLPL